MIKLLENTRLAEDFWIDEFANHLKDGNFIKIDLELVDCLQIIRYTIGRMTITSGYRIERFNKRVGGASNSFHLSGKAADFTADFSQWNKYSLIKLFRAAGIKNMKFYYRKNSQGKYYLQRCHVDIGKTWNGKDFCVLANKYE